MENKQTGKEPDNTAVRTALWRALHKQVDAPPYILEDELGLALVAPGEGWQDRPDMKFTRRLRASIIARSRFIEDLAIERSEAGVTQYVILGAGLDTFAQRHPEIASRLQVYEIDQPDTLIWKANRLRELGFGRPAYLHFVPVDFEISSWWDELLKAGFDPDKPTLVACTGVTLYLSREAVRSTLSQLASLASGSTLAMTFYLPMELLEDEDKPMQERAEKGARAAGTPFVSFFTLEGIRVLAREAGLRAIDIISTKQMERRYFGGRTDGLQPASGELFLLART